MKYFIANWKANKNLREAEDWFNQFLTLYKDRPEVTVVICPPFPFIKDLKQKTEQYKNLKLGVQDISYFEEGAYTGEVSAKTVQGLANYAIIGHSERRKYFNEDEKILFKKFKLARKYGIEPVFCIRGADDKIPFSIKILAYEPVYAIGTGFNEPVKKVIELKTKLNLKPDVVYLYGGSVNKNNISSYLQNKNIDGFLIGGASLDPKKFYEILCQF